MLKPRKPEAQAERDNRVAREARWLGTQSKGLADGGTALWAGIDQYLYYRVNDTWSWGMRFEWFQDADRQDVLSAFEQPEGERLSKFVFTRSSRSCYHRSRSTNETFEEEA